MNESSEPSGLLSIERVVAFVLGPAVTAGAGRLSVWLAESAGVHLSGPEIVAAFGAGGVAAAGLVYKWLHGRQLEMTLSNTRFLAFARPLPADEASVKQAPDPIPLAEADPAPSSAADGAAIAQ